MNRGDSCSNMCQGKRTSNDLHIQQVNGLIHMVPLYSGNKHHVAISNKLAIYVLTWKTVYDKVNLE